MSGEEQRPGFVFSPELDTTSQDTLRALEEAINQEPGRAERLLQRMFEGTARSFDDMDDALFVEKVERGLNASREGRHLSFDETTEDEIFTPQARRLVESVRNAHRDKEAEARRANSIHRLLGYTGCVATWQLEKAQQIPPSVA